MEGEEGQTGQQPGVEANGTGFAAPWIASAPEAVRDLLAKAQTLTEFLRDADKEAVLNLAERRLLVDQALIVFEQNYVHLPLKVAMHAVNPVQRLRVMRARLLRASIDKLPPDRVFHADLLDVFHSVRDLHTFYGLPAPYKGKFAFLPFQIEEYFEPDQATPRYVITRVVDGYAAPGLAAGARVTHWNGIPIERAVQINGDRFAGSNAAARRARGVETMTVRPLTQHLPPDEEWVTINYVGDPDNTTYERREPWLVMPNRPTFTPDSEEMLAEASRLGIDDDLAETAQAKLILFVPNVVGQQRQAATEARSGATTADEPVTVGDSTAPGLLVASPTPATPEAPVSPEAPAMPPPTPGAPPAPAAAPPTGIEVVKEIDVSKNLAGFFRARHIRTISGVFGHLRIFSFSRPAGEFLKELFRLLGELPPDGLILDVRGNTGGTFGASEGTLQTLTPRRIVPEPLQFINTPLNLRICRAHPIGTTLIESLTPWVASMDQATETGAIYSAGFALNTEEFVNRSGQRYYGPVVLITDARCYSATDTFVAGFQDHEIGDILAVDENTGAGGANVWKHDFLWSLLELPTRDPANPYQILPNGAVFSVAIRRALRVGALAGTPIEDLGVLSKQRHQMTLDDLLHDNVDLLNRAGSLLKAKQPARSLKVGLSQDVPNGPLTVTITSANLARADVLLNDRPLHSLDLGAEPAAVLLPDVKPPATLKVLGYIPETPATRIGDKPVAPLPDRLAAARTVRLVAGKSGKLAIDGTP